MAWCGSVAAVVGSPVRLPGQASRILGNEFGIEAGEGPTRRTADFGYHARPSSVSPRGVLPHGRAPRADLRAARGAELGQDVGYVSRDRLGREHELFGDLRVSEARRDKPGDLELTLAQRIPRLGRLGLVK